MQKMPFIHILMTFYKKNTMLYVGRNWKGNGYPLLLVLVLYLSIFVSFSWNRHMSESYDIFYRPAMNLLPPVSYSDGKFSFDAKMPVKIKHPITQKEVFYIDTNVSEIPEEAYNYRTIITSDLFVISDIPYIFRGHSFTHNVVLFPLLLTKSPFKNNDYIDSTQLVKSGDEISKISFIKMFFLAFAVLGTTEFVKTTFIAILVMFMFKSGPVKTNKHKDFKLVHRLCVLTYIPILITNSLYFFNLSTPGIFMLITTSFVHIILLMMAIHVNVMDGEENMPSSMR